MVRSESKPCVVVDTREQRPWQFDLEAVDVTVGTLSTGDYSLLGHETEVCIERKSLDDFVSTVIHDRGRFERELARMKDYSLRAIIVEASYRDLRDHKYTSKAHPSSVFGLACCLMVDHSVPVLFAEDRHIAARVCERLLRRYAQNLEKAAANAQ